MIDPGIPVNEVWTSFILKIYGEKGEKKADSG